MDQTLIEALLGKTESHPGGCILWIGSINSCGYGQVWWQGRHLMAHRVIYEATRGRIPDGLHIDHLCRVHNCVNPNHMEPVTPMENVRRGLVYKANDTHCTNGHEWTFENTYRFRKYRRCRSCAKIHTARYKAKVAGRHVP